MTLSGYPSATVAVTIGAGFTSFMIASTRRKSAGRALRIRPAQRVFFDIAAGYIKCVCASNSASNDRGPNRHGPKNSFRLEPGGRGLQSVQSTRIFLEDLSLGGLTEVGAGQE